MEKERPLRLPTKRVFEAKLAETWNKRHKRGDLRRKLETWKVTIDELYELYYRSTATETAEKHASEEWQKFVTSIKLARPDAKQLRRAANVIRRLKVTPYPRDLSGPAPRMMRITEWVPRVGKQPIIYRYDFASYDLDSVIQFLFGVADDIEIIAEKAKGKTRAGEMLANKKIFIRDFSRLVARKNLGRGLRLHSLGAAMSSLIFGPVSSATYKRASEREEKRLAKVATA